MSVEMNAASSDGKQVPLSFSVLRLEHLDSSQSKPALSAPNTQ